MEDKAHSLVFKELSGEGSICPHLLAEGVGRHRVTYQQRKKKEKAENNWTSRKKKKKKKQFGIACYSISLHS